MRHVFLLLMLSTSVFSQTQPPIGPGVSQELAKWRAARYSDVWYKLNLTLEKMSPVLKGTIEIRVKVNGTSAVLLPSVSTEMPKSEMRPSPIILDWRKLAGHEKDSTLTNVSINGATVVERSMPSQNATWYLDSNEHLVFGYGVVTGENVIKLDFTSPILTSGSAITRYVDKEDGAEYIYSLFVPSDASTAFPVFDQPDLKARFTLGTWAPKSWRVVTNTDVESQIIADGICGLPTVNRRDVFEQINGVHINKKPLPTPTPPSTQTPSQLCEMWDGWAFAETKPISTYVFAFAAGPWEQVAVPPVSGGEPSGVRAGASPPSGLQDLSLKTPAHGPSAIQPTPSELTSDSQEGRLAPALVDGDASSTVPRDPPDTSGGSDTRTSIFVRKSQAAKFKPHAAEVFRLTREGVKYLETYFDYQFPFPKCDLVLIPEFPFGGMEHAGATFLRESSIIFPTEPTKGDYISRANLIFHETAHQWFGDTVTMKWFDDLWLKEGFAEFMAYKTLERVMPDANAWKVFYERNKQAAYATDSTKGTTPIYQEIANLNSAKSAYGNIVYRKAPSFLRQAEFHVGADRFQEGVRAFLKKYEFGNATWEDLVNELRKLIKYDDMMRPRLKDWAKNWITKRGLSTIRVVAYQNRGSRDSKNVGTGCRPVTKNALGEDTLWDSAFYSLMLKNGKTESFTCFTRSSYADELNMPTMNFQRNLPEETSYDFIFPNYGDYGYGIFLMDKKSREFVIKNFDAMDEQFVRSMMWGSLWDSVREGEMDPREYVELVVRQLQKASLSSSQRGASTTQGQAKACTLNCGEQDESIVTSILGRVSTAMNYYLSPAQAVTVAPRLEDVLIDRMQNAETPGQRITFYRAFVANASTEHGRTVLKAMLKRGNLSEPPAVVGGLTRSSKTSGETSGVNADVQPPATAGGSDLRTKDKFDIVTRLIILGDPEAPKLLADLEKTETSDDAKRYAYAARAGFGTSENKAKFWSDYTANKDFSESWIETSLNAFSSIRHSDLSLPYLQKALAELPRLKRDRKIFFVNNWLAAWIGGQRSQAALDIVNKFLADNPALDKDLRLKILENADLIERAVRIRSKWSK